jgi:hypothetical protein
VRDERRQLTRVEPRLPLAPPLEQLAPRRTERAVQPLDERERLRSDELRYRYA